jgi:hypothetical protein
MRKGLIGTVTPTGKFGEFAAGPELVSTVGMWADMTRNRLLACVSDPGVSIKTSEKTKNKLARLVVYDLSSKALIKKIELSDLKKGGHFCNDLTTDDAGNIYVTDSFSSLIYKITSDYKASIFVESDKFKGEGFGLNGIVYHPGGFLVAAKYNDGTLWKIPLKNPKELMQIKLKEPYSGLDGLVLLTEKDIVGVQNNKIDKVHKFHSEDSWKTAETVESASAEVVFPTTAVKAGNNVYVIEGKLNEIFENMKTATTSDFNLKAVPFK